DESTSEVTFSLDGGNLADGGLKSVGSTAPLLTSLPIEVQSEGGKRWAFAVYVSPTNFSATATTQRDREIKILAQAGASPAIPKVLRLQRPPVVLVHGIWSSGTGAWRQQLDLVPATFESLLTGEGFRVTVADYEPCNFCSF